MARPVVVSLSHGEPRESQRLVKRADVGGKRRRYDGLPFAPVKLRRPRYDGLGIRGQLD